MIKSIIKLCIAFLFLLYLASPIFAEEPSEGAMSLEEGLALTEQTGEGVITGKVTSLDTASNTLTVKLDDDRELLFSIVSEETILWKGIEDIELADIKEGDEVEVGYYTGDNGTLIASWVDMLIIEDKIVPAEVKKLESEAEEKTSPDENLKGSH